jgi:hypothetical protein
MTAAAPVRLIVELDPVAEPVQGRVRRDGRDMEMFVGWMGLTRAVELLSQPAAAD